MNILLFKLFLSCFFHQPTFQNSKSTIEFAMLLLLQLVCRIFKLAVCCEIHLVVQSYYLDLTHIITHLAQKNWQGMQRIL